MAQRVIHVSRRSFWILSRYLSKPDNPDVKLPGDLIFYSRAAHARSLEASLETINAQKHAWFSNICTQQQSYPPLAVGTDSKHPPYVVISDAYLEKTMEERIDVKNLPIDHLEEGKLVFQDQSHENVDAMIFCTGYRADLPFFSSEILDQLGFQPDDELQPLLLHKTVFPKNLFGMAFVGLYRGPYFGVMELQARWACMVFSGNLPPPSKEEITLGIAEEQKIRAMVPRPQFPHGNYVGLCEELAQQIGVAPNLETIEIKDPDLYQKLMDGPFTVASYRLEGFGRKPSIALPMIEQINKRFLGS